MSKLLAFLARRPWSANVAVTDNFLDLDLRLQHFALFQQLRPFRRPFWPFPSLADHEGIIYQSQTVLHPRSALILHDNPQISLEVPSFVAVVKGVDFAPTGFAVKDFAVTDFAVTDFAVKSTVVGFPAAVVTVVIGSTLKVGFQ